jgi:hypothetical protein
MIIIATWKRVRKWREFLDLECICIEALESKEKDAMISISIGTNEVYNVPQLLLARNHPAPVVP